MGLGLGEGRPWPNGSTWIPGTSWPTHLRTGLHSLGEDHLPPHQLVYVGRAAGTPYGHKGGGSDILCMPDDPEYLNYGPGVQIQSCLRSRVHSSLGSGPKSSHPPKHAVCSVLWDQNEGSHDTCQSELPPTMAERVLRILDGTGCHSALLCLVCALMNTQKPFLENMVVVLYPVTLIK